MFVVYGEDVDIEFQVKGVKSSFYYCIKKFRIHTHRSSTLGIEKCLGEGHYESQVEYEEYNIGKQLFATNTGLYRSRIGVCNMVSPTIHLRSETKPLEHRSALTPTTAKALLDAGYIVNIERSPIRIFDDTEFENIGANLVPTGSWPQAPQDHIIVGLKELPENEDFPLKHTHVQFAHCFKGQDGWQNVLGRFPRGGGTLLDLEFLQDEAGRRVAAFGYHAGFAGAALAVEAWAWQLHRPREPMQSVKPYKNEAELLHHIATCLRDGERVKPNPKVLVMGALGRCGRGAVELLEKIGLPSDNILKVSRALYLTFACH